MQEIKHTQLINVDTDTFNREKILQAQKYNLEILLHSAGISFDDPYKALDSIAHFTHFASEHSPGIILGSGGTSSNRKIFNHDWPFYDFVCALGARGIFTQNKSNNPPKVIANCLSAGPLWGGFLFVHDVIKNLNLIEAPLTASVTDEDFFELVRTLSVDTIIGTPTFIISKFLSEKRSNLESIKNALYIGEEFPKARADELNTLYPDLAIKPLAYSTSEVGSIGHQCPHQTGNTYHINEDAFVIEFDPIPDSDLFALVTTPLIKVASPLFRVPIGDLVKPIDGECPCGSKFKQMQLGGRQHGFNICGTTIHQNTIIDSLSQVSEISSSDIQIVVDKMKSSISLLISKEYENLLPKEKVLNQLNMIAQFKLLGTKSEFGGIKIEYSDPNLFIKTKASFKHQTVVIKDS